MIYECNEQQFIENIVRLLNSSRGGGGSDGNRLVVNRRIMLCDDHRYGPAILPDQEFGAYAGIMERKALKRSVYAKIPFIDEFHNRFYDAGDILHSSSSLGTPRLSIPYYRVEYSFSLWGNSYIYTFDVLFEPEVVIEKRRLPSRRRGSRTSAREGSSAPSNGSMLVHVLRFNQPDERMFSINIPKQVIVLDVKRMIRTIGIDNEKI
ncbi:MAG: hypothetical protein RMJ59_05155 [Candidatus Nitrosocaldus sp.]|nr:hypothetical protein [Candidatus Nitrosocaldus sp.]MCS7141897.1 hypothetical protein [Candidatus Nitrosocaldus sp.]MDW8000856.1 hypothetical protein [Candidatus Nitrosocaldus sp.]MDW8275750.1 hypothetical protein [Candidatus Nitrosocaldus sp.]